MMNFLSFLSLLLAAFLVLPVTSDASTIFYQSEDESIRLEFSGYAKNFFALQLGGERFLPEKLPKSFESLDKLIHAMAPNAPHEDPKVLWQRFRDEIGTLAQDQLWIRLAFKLKYDEASFKIAYELRSWTGSSPFRLIGTLPAVGPLFSAGNDEQSSSFSIGAMTSFDDRFVDFPAVLLERHSFRLTHQLDRLYFFYSFDFADLTVGRQPISMGVGRIFRPADVLAPFSPQELDTEQRRGVDALKIEIPIGDLSEMAFIASLQRLYPSCPRKADETVKLSKNSTACAKKAQTSDYFDDPSPSFIAKFKTSISKMDLFLMAGYLYEDFIGAAGFSLAIGNFAFQGSGTYRYPLIESDKKHEYGLFNTMFNVEFNQPAWKLIVDFSYFHQNFGSGDPKNYIVLSRDHRYLRGETFLLGTDYLGLAVNWEIHPLLNFRGIALFNILDSSFLFVPIFELSVQKNLYMTLSSYIGIGDAPTSAMKDEQFNIELHSEFGTVGTLFLLGLRAYY